VFVGADGRGGAWQREEVEAALRSQLKNGDFRVIPVLLPGAPPKEKAPELPPLLANKIWIEFGEDLSDPAMWRLECGICGQSPGRGRPPQETIPLPKPDGYTRRSSKPVPQYDPRRLTAPGGALDTDARFYIERTASTVI